MSSILKALQKLESDSLEEGGGQIWPQGFQTGQPGLDKQNWYASKIFWSFLVASLVISVAAAIMLASQKSPSPISKVKRSSVKSDGAPDRSKELASTGRPAHGIQQRRNSVAPDRIAPTNTFRGAEESKVSSIAKVSNRVPETSPKGLPPSQATSKPSTIIRKAPLKTPLKSEMVTKKKPAEIDAAKQSGKRLPVTTDETVRMEDQTATLAAQTYHGREMKLHAISWTPEPENRIAVINGSIVHEGGLVGGYRIHQINKDDILVMKDGEFWKLVFVRR